MGRVHVWVPLPRTSSSPVRAKASEVNVTRVRVRALRRRHFSSLKVVLAASAFVMRRHLKAFGALRNHQGTEWNLSKRH